MAAIDLPKSPNVFHPEKPSAVGSRNSLAQEYRGQQEEANRLLEEETNKVINHLTARMPKAALESLDVMGGIKEKLYNYFNQNFQNMFNRYMVTAEDEMVKKLRNLVDKEETQVLARYTPKEVAVLLNQIGGADRFNTGEIEKSMVNMYGHLQGHIQQGIGELEAVTGSLLRQKADTGAFVRGENAYSVVKCAFKDNAAKPKNVTDVKLSINILDTELISPIFHYQVTQEYLIKELLSKHIIDLINREIEKIKDERLDQGLEEISDSEILFSKVNRVIDYTDDVADNVANNEKAKRYKLVSKNIMEKLSGLGAEIDPAAFDQMNVRENLKKIIDIENLRNRGFNTAVNSITSILDNSGMGYQFIENFKNSREVIIREYEDTDAANLPDERYRLRLKYFDSAQLTEERKTYEIQLMSFGTEIQHVWDIVQIIYEDSKPFGKITDFNDLAKKWKNRIKKTIKDQTRDPLYENINIVWDEISFVKPAETEVERSNRTCLHEKNRVFRRIKLIREKLAAIYDHQYPIERRVVEDRIDFLEKEFHRFDYMINPYHLLPGLVLDIDITSVKRKKITLNGMAGVLSEFLQGVSRGFEDAAFASFSLRREEPKREQTRHYQSEKKGTAEEYPDYVGFFIYYP